MARLEERILQMLNSVQQSLAGHSSVTFTSASKQVNKP